MDPDFYSHLAEARQLVYLSRKGFPYDQAAYMDPDRRLALCVAYGEQDGDLPFGDLVPPPTKSVMDTQAARLRKFAIGFLSYEGCYDDDALGALALNPYDGGWFHWGQRTMVVEGQWFLWRHPDHPGDIHADQVGVNENGQIDVKYGCGLDDYPECQPAHFDDEVRALLAAKQARIDAKNAESVCSPQRGVNQ